MTTADYENTPVYSLKQMDDALAETERLEAANAEKNAVLQAILDHESDEVAKDDFAYDRMVENYRAAARAGLSLSAGKGWLPPEAAAAVAATVKWVQTDMAYKSPEQLIEYVGLWQAKLVGVLDTLKKTGA